ncbi:CsbD family protein [Maribacter cobaltidurans]|uniref:General stress protein CsbD n=1 Tax=Maribacter cobaltidurans TaxID=1178778 RepID=A0A223V5U4_9FLAO|nr:CsbD family protein [Maribacter cobaltidurans]ASV30785.1 general stress protein CsbD [Maribacter cobaltidurans]GGD81757.1 CsbD family protein [Maribacter cobaltidurans]
MNKDQLEGKWKQVKGEFKQKYGNVTDDDTTYAEGKFDEMLGRLQEKTGKKKEDLKQEIETW